MQRPDDADVVVDGQRQEVDDGDDDGAQAERLQRQDGAREPFRNGNVVNERQQTAPRPSKASKDPARTEIGLFFVIPRLSDAAMKHATEFKIVPSK